MPASAHASFHNHFCGAIRMRLDPDREALIPRLGLDHKSFLDPIKQRIPLLPRSGIHVPP